METKQQGIATEENKRELRIGLLGFGNVGASVAKLLAAQQVPGLRLARIYNRDVARKRVSRAAAHVPGSVVWTERVEDVLAAEDVDVVVELAGGMEPAEGWVRAALSAGKPVVTANKQLIAYRGSELALLASEHGVHLLYGAAVAGGVPVIPGIKQGLGGDQILRVSGIVNGTCNFILSQMELGAEYVQVLREAQRLGYAEADPTADVGGFDARAKLCILSRIALQAELEVESVPVQTIAGVEAVDFAYARELGCTVRQVALAEMRGDGVHARVAPMLVPRSSPIAWSHGTQNMVVTTGRYGGDVVFSGHGAGGEPTAVAVISDLLAVAHRCATVELPVARREVTGEFIARHYLRFVVEDRPGIIYEIAGALAAVEANLDSILQRPGHPRERLPFVVTTEASSSEKIARALEQVAEMECMVEAPLCLQILEVEKEGAHDRQ